MDLRQIETALKRARKRVNHATRQAMEAETPRAMKRQARRLANARRLEDEARWTFERATFEGA